MHSFWRKYPLRNFMFPNKYIISFIRFLLKYKTQYWFCKIIWNNFYYAHTLPPWKKEYYVETLIWNIKYSEFIVGRTTRNINIPYGHKY